MSSTLDLLSGQSATASSSTQRRSPLIWLPLGLLLAAAALFIAVSYEQLIPAIPVQVDRVIAARVQTDTAATPSDQPPSAPAQASTVVFQAAGWVEADPLPVHATALVSGVVQEVHVLEGATVSQGQALASLDPADFDLQLRSREAALEQAEAHVLQQQAAVDNAKASKAHWLARQTVQEAKVAERQDRHTRLAAAGRAVSIDATSQAALALATAKAELAALKTEAKIIDAAIGSAAASLAAAKARLSLAQTAVDQARLDRQRCTITAPIDGVIQSLYAIPGRKQMLGSDTAHSTTVATLFDPNKLQVRVDIALADAAGLYIGQAVRVNCEALPDEVFTGTVTRIVGEADLTRNTLQAKVALQTGSPLLRPDMLVRAQFLQGTGNSTSPSSKPTSQHAGNQNLDMLLASRCLPQPVPQQTTVWIVDADNRAAQRQISIGASRHDAHVITSGLQLGDLVIRQAPADLRPGDRVRVLPPEAQP